MTNASFRRDNHYVSSGYLKRWASPGGRIWTYRILVSHPGVPLWKSCAPRGVAYHSHLYTRIIAGQESDEIERWFDREFESPVDDVLHKATSDSPLTREDWNRLIRFLAVQDVRTPAWLEEQRGRWDASLPGLMEESLRDSVERMEELVRAGKSLPKATSKNDDGLPLRVTAKREPGQKSGHIGVDMLVGRGLWLWCMQRAIERTSMVLHQHKWTIIRPPKDSAWTTSDSPVIRLNFSSPTKYDFRGGWGSLGTEILLPLGPQHLLYTKIGNKHPPRRGERMHPDQAQLVRRFIAERAYRLIFAVERDDTIPRLRPRVEDAGLFQSEQEQWEAWHPQQTAAERELMDCGTQESGDHEHSDGLNTPAAEAPSSPTDPTR